MKMNTNIFKKSCSMFGASLFTAVLCLSVPMAQASDVSLYQNSVSGNVTLMLTLDRSDSMSVTGLTGGNSCDIPESYEPEPYLSQNLILSLGQVRTYSDSNSYAVYRDVPNPPINPNEKDYTKLTYDSRFTYAENIANRDFGRAYCRAKAPSIKFRAYYNTARNNVGWRYDVCTPKSPTVTFVDKYEDCDFSKERNLTRAQLNAKYPGSLTGDLASGTLKYRYVNGTYTPYVYYFYSVTNNYVRFYDRFTKLKDAMYQLFLGEAPLRIEDDKYIGLAVFPFDPGTTATTERGYIAAPAKRLGDNNGQTRIDLMNVVAALRPKVNTPTPAVYAEVAAYLMGTNTRRQLDKTVLLAQRVLWNACYGDRDENGKCIAGDLRPSTTNEFQNNKGWSANNKQSSSNGTRGWENGWLSYFNGIYYSYWDNTTRSWNIQESFQEPNTTKYDFKESDLPPNTESPTRWYAQDRIFAKYAMWESNDPNLTQDQLYASRKWRKCSAWDNIGKCQTWGSEFSTTSAPYQPTDDGRLILQYLEENSTPNITDAQKANAYTEVPYATNCNGVSFSGAGNVSCYGANTRIPTHVSLATGEWISSCTDKTYNNPLYRYYDRCLSTKNWQGGGSGLTNALNEAGVTFDQLLNDPTISREPCRVATRDTFGNTDRYYPAICYIRNSTTFIANPYETGTNSIYSGFNDSVDSAKVNGSNGSFDGMDAAYLQPDSIKQNITTQQCGAQGIYILSDGEPVGGTDPTILKNLYIGALSGANNPTASSFTCANPIFGSAFTWSGCWANLSQRLLLKNGLQSNLNRPIKTATVGYGVDFQKIPSFNNKLSVQENAANISGISSTIVNANKKNLALLGVYGEGGWYSATSMDDIIISIKNLLNDLSQKIDPINTGTVTIPQNGINPAELLDYAFYPEFQPTPDSSVPLWLGNVKRFNVIDGELKDNLGNSIFDSSGSLVKDPNDQWSGGAFAKLMVRPSNSTATKRVLYINQKLTYDDQNYTGVAPFDTQGSLMKVDDNYLGNFEPVTLNQDRSITPNGAGFYDGKIQYILSLLGYSNIDIKQPVSTLDPTKVRASKELKQFGAVIHSTPVVLTQKGRVNLVKNVPVSSERDEYVMFGTTQGLLHVVDADTGAEKFAFLPQEMLDSQPEAMLQKDKVDSSSKGVVYGIDAPWTSFAEYVPTSDGFLTVGTGKNNLKGKQWVYGGLRMGGRSYYSLDLSDLDKPSLKFRINPDAAAAGTPLSFMGQSWSKPTLTYVNWKGKPKLVMFVGGGYDKQYENAAYETSTSDNGAGVYMFDADSGELLWWSSANAVSANSASLDSNGKLLAANALNVPNMKHSVVSRISTLDRDGDGLTDQLYFGDLGGQVWRIDINNLLTTSTNDLSMPFATRAVRLLNLHVNNGLSPRFYEAPSLTPHEGKFVAISIGSGNRSTPLTLFTGSGYKNDGIYVIYDKDIAVKQLNTNSSLVLKTSELDISKLKDLSNPSTTAATYDGNDGWYSLFADSSTLQFKQRYKVLGETVAINKRLYVPVFDDIPSNSASSLTVCGAGVRGQTTIKLFCLPYGRCPTGTNTSDVLSVGSGIYGINIGQGSSKYNRRVIGGVCKKVSGTTVCLDKTKGTYEPTLVKDESVPEPRLIPTSWFDKIPKP